VTLRLYQQDSYLTTFSTRVVGIDKYQDKSAIILAETIFYPESGGQPSDTGYLFGPGKAPGEVPDQTATDRVRVESAVEEGERIFHLISGVVPFQIGDQVCGVTDWKARFANMQQHTGQHILSQAFLRLLDAPTVSSRLGTEHSTIDVNRLDLAWEDVERVEELGNSIVWEDRPVKIYQGARQELASLRVKRPIDRETIRVVEVEGFDKSPCGGTHTRRTGEVGMIKILRWERVRDTSRVEFICGSLALADYSWKSKFVVELAQDLTTKDTNVPRLVRGLYGESRDLRKESEHLKRELVRYQLDELEAEASLVGEVKVVAGFYRDRSPEEIREIATQLARRKGRVALLACGRDRLHLVFSRSEDVPVDMRELIRMACDLVGGKGGGKPEYCQGGGKSPEQAEQALRRAEEGLRQRLESRA
jgi:alanyl-tRNA synthetase